MELICRISKHVSKMPLSKRSVVLLIVWCLVFEGVTSKCKNTNKYKSNCQEWADAGECLSSANFMLENCPEVCETASCECAANAVAGFAADTKCKCLTWALDGKMVATDTNMKKDCPSTFQLATTVNCGKPPSITNAQARFERTFYISSVKYYCLDGYEKTSGTTGERWCHKDSSWKKAWHQTDPVCTMIKCPKPADVVGYTWKVSDSTLVYETTATYTCDSSLGMAGEAHFKCSKEKKWEGTLPTCSKVQCGTPVSIDKGQWSYGTDQKDNYKDNVTYTCQTGYSLAKGKTSENITCQLDGKWSIAPFCVFGNTGPGIKPVPYIGDADAAVVFASMFPIMFLLICVVVVLSIIIHKCRMRETNRNKQLNTVYDV